MGRDRIGGKPLPRDGREEFGAMLRKAYPLGSGSFEGLAGLLEDGGDFLRPPDGGQQATEASE